MPCNVFSGANLSRLSFCTSTFFISTNFNRPKSVGDAFKLVRPTTTYQGWFLAPLFGSKEIKKLAQITFESW